MQYMRLPEMTNIRPTGPTGFSFSAWVHFDEYGSAGSGDISPASRILWLSDDELDEDYGNKIIVGSTGIDALGIVTKDGYKSDFEVYDWVCDIQLLSAVSKEGWRIEFSEQFLQVPNQGHRVFHLNPDAFEDRQLRATHRLSLLHAVVLRARLWWGVYGLSPRWVAGDPSREALLRVAKPVGTAVPLRRSDPQSARPQAGRRRFGAAGARPRAGP